MVDGVRARLQSWRVSRAPLGEWRPLERVELRALLDAQPARWWLAGGHALELFAGRSWRAHGDIDAGILRADQPRVFGALAGWELHAARGGELQRLAPGELAPREAHGVWCRADGHGPWRFQLLLDPSEAGHWLFRRDPSVRVPLDELVARSADGCPYLRPEIQLLWKAKHTRPEDDADFAAVAPLLSPPARSWLRAALARVHASHAWLARAELAP